MPWRARHDPTLTMCAIPARRAVEKLLPQAEARVYLNIETFFNGFSNVTDGDGTVVDCFGSPCSRPF